MLFFSAASAVMGHERRGSAYVSALSIYAHLHGSAATPMYAAVAHFRLQTPSIQWLRLLDAMAESMQLARSSAHADAAGSVSARCSFVHLYSSRAGMQRA